MLQCVGHCVSVFVVLDQLTKPRTECATKGGYHVQSADAVGRVTKPADGYAICFFFLGGNDWSFRYFSWNYWCLSLLSKSTEDLSFCFSLILFGGNNRSFWNFGWNYRCFFLLSKSAKNMSSGYSFLLLSCYDWSLWGFSWNHWCFSMLFRMMFVMMMFLLRQTLDASWFFRFGDVKILEDFSFGFLLVSHSSYYWGFGTKFLSLGGSDNN